MLAALKAQRDARATELRTGQVVASTSANAHAVAFSAPSQQGLTPSDLFEFWQEMVDLYNDVDTYLTGESVSDADILEEMLYRLPAGPISYQNTYTGVMP